MRGAALLASSVAIAFCCASRADGAIYALAGDTIRRIDPGSGDVALVSGSAPSGRAALQPDGRVVAIDGPLDRLVRIDLAAQSAAPLPLLADTFVQAASDLDASAGGIVWLASVGDLVRVDTASGAAQAYDPSRGLGVAVVDIGLEPAGAVLADWIDFGNIGVASAAALDRFDPVGTAWEDEPLTYEQVSYVTGARNGDVAATPNGRIFVSIRREDPRIAEVLPASHDRVDLSSAVLGTGPLLVQPVTLRAASNDELLVMDEANASIVAVDTQTGDRTLVSGDGVGTGPALVDLIGVEPSGAILARGADAVLRVDRATGDRTIAFATAVGGGVAPSPGALAAGCSGLVATTGDPGMRLVRVDPATGDRTVITGSGTYRTYRLAPRCDAGGSVWALRGPEGATQPSLVRIDVASGDTTVVSGPSAGTGPLWSNADADVAFGPQGVFVSDAAAVLRVDSSTGERIIVSDAGHGTGTPLAGLSFIALGEADELFVAGDGGVVRIDLATGDRSLVPGTLLPLADLAVAADGALLLATTGAGLAPDELVRVDPATGDGSVLARGTFAAIAVAPEPGGTAAALFAIGALALRRSRPRSPRRGGCSARAGRAGGGAARR